MSLHAQYSSTDLNEKSNHPFPPFPTARAASNQIYIPELDRIVLGDKRGTRSFLNVKVGILSSLAYIKFNYT